ncbi:diacylglycerol kinase family lipid kinase [Halalkalibacterium halodurans]|uniref:Multidrug resistance protein n=1 Tax=Halalkalibacterium halodurans (strain ATCC BAA-125 / DSM 18197 / FERM 7344 / JCM 9153 / C-125) TaxID=272558 RepID=Q9KC00_HALH5|nr:diacylglycerol kinase family protein [Halalkalibacterium halodurans]MDY7222334.1 diacylglycerol kinase family protein [Halalkalibacterium halodurans]MDY7241555.1 diacylglycerol kinase family protein [Halalkalibacterium halodurans]MED4082359.1 diacylglycerol kinase family lipid kinase [Halalkalibacterium halodurans]MED4083490.1 diacylglycerol kinase family lipid kinase [Halalkalibacterium halodurans]MED4105803.1 diacylglycerol kinase family lipid kinase [Halalkalibacterium halodurans]
MFQRAFLLYNGKAGNGKTDKYLKDVVPRALQSIGELTIIPSKEKGDIESICREREVDLIIVMGGDGTVHECINGLAVSPSPPPLVVLPTGTCNDFARSLRIPLSFVEAGNLLESGTWKRVPLIQANHRCYTNFLGMGIITTASEGTNPELKETFGRFSYFLSALQSLREPSPFSYTITSTKGSMSGQAILLLVMHGQFLGTLPVQLDENAIEQPFVTIYIVKEGGLPFIKDLVKGLVSPAMVNESDHIDRMTCDQCQIETEPVLSIDMDGEIYMKTPVNITTVGKVITVRVPDVNVTSDADHTIGGAQDTP